MDEARQSEVIAMKRLMVFLLASLLMIAAVPALGDDVFTVGDVDGGFYESDQAYLRITCPVAADSQVTVMVADATGRITYQRDYGICSSTFRSEDIYLCLNDAETLYTITVSAGDDQWSFQVDRVMPRLKENTACSVGYLLSDLSGTGRWQTVTLLDLDALEGAALTVPMHASGAYTLGEVTFTVQNGALTVSAAIADGLDGEIDRATVYVATDPIAAQNLGTPHFSGLTGKLNTPIPTGGAAVAAVYVRLTVSFDPSGVPASPETVLDGQEALWQRLLETPMSDSVG